MRKALWTKCEGRDGVVSLVVPTVLSKGYKDPLQAEAQELDQIVRVLESYFRNIFSINPTREKIEVRTVGVSTRILEEDNAELDWPFARDDVELTMKQMGPMKAPWLDGLHSYDVEILFEETW
ncbi:hypothetical protein Fot_10610 [Forsythia ovata]|uniref:Uncharacterized protein n=1 Tax=Forsythia ovata TaxID=205694 RepID=A0ABD1WL16_9LAMI